jgi:hypothetical protein
MKLSNGDVFEGMWSNDERCGFGVMKFSSGEEYKGEWKHNKLHGDTPSFRISFNLLDVISHPAISFCFAGKGTLKHVNGDIFLGSFHEGLASGTCFFLVFHPPLAPFVKFQRFAFVQLLLLIPRCRTRHVPV